MVAFIEGFHCSLKTHSTYNVSTWCPGLSQGAALQGQLWEGVHSGSDTKVGAEHELDACRKGDEMKSAVAEHA